MRNPRRNGIRLIAPLVATLLWVLPAAATTYYVASNGSNSNTGLSAASPKALSWITSALTPLLNPGDVVYFAAGSYRGQGALKNRRSGTPTQPIRFIGDTLTPSNVVLDGFDMGMYSQSATYTDTRGFRFLARNATRDYNGGSNDLSQGTISAQHTYLGWCVFDSTKATSGKSSDGVFGLGRGSHWSVMDHITYTGNRWDMSAPQEIRNTLCVVTADTLTGCVLRYSTFTINQESDYAQAAMRFSYVDQLECYGNRFNVTICANGQNGTFKFYGVRNSRFHDNRWTARLMRDNTPPSRGGTCIECGTSYFREVAFNVSFERDTFYYAGGLYPLQLMITAAGTCTSYSHNNTYNACVFNDSIGTDGPVVYQQDYTHDLTFTNNVIVSRTGTSLFGSLAGCNNCKLENNTLVTLGTSTNKLAEIASTNAGTTFRSNILYAPNATDTTLVQTLAGITSDYNLFYSGDSTDVYAAGTLSTRCQSSLRADCHSVWGDPLLAGGATWAWNYDAHIRSTSPARGAGFEGVDIGAFQFGDPTPIVRRYWVAPEARGGSSTANYVNDPDTTHTITLARANQIAEPGALFVLLGGDYTADTSVRDSIISGASYGMETGTAVAPLTGGFSFDSTLVVRYASKWYYDNAIAKTTTSAPDTNSYRVSAITVTQPFVKVQGLTANGAITVYSGTSNGSTCVPTTAPTGSYCWRATDDSITWCKARSVSVGGASRVYFNNCWVWTPLSAGASGATVGLNGIWGAYGSLSNLPGSASVAFTDCFIKTHVNWGQAGLQIGAHSDGVTFTRCALHCELEPASNTDTLAFVQIRDASNVRFVDCRWRVNADSLVETAPYAATDSVNAIGLSLSDGAQFVTFLRDTLDLGCRSYNGGVIQVRAQGGLKTSVNNVVWQDCIVRGDWAFIPTVKLARWSFLRSVLGSSRLSPLSFGRMNAGDLASDSLIVDRCTIYSDGAYPALACLLPSSVQSVRLTRNIYYRRATAVGQADTGAVVRLGGLVSAQPGQVTMDENVYYSATDSITNSVYVTGWQRTGVGPDSAFTYPLLPRLGSQYHAEWEANSLWGSPGLTATSIDSTFDGSLACQRNARRAYAINYFYAHGDSAVGATQTEANVIPAAATALDTTLATPTAITVSFAAPANNGRTGSGTCAGYYVAYSTRQGDLTETNWNALSKVTATAAAPGVTVTKQITGLSNVTTYWFAVRALSRCGTLGPLSTPQCAITRKADGTSSLQNCRSDL